jgi:hypothetical protein
MKKMTAAVKWIEANERPLRLSISSHLRQQNLHRGENRVALL